MPLLDVIGCYNSVVMVKKKKAWKVFQRHHTDLIGLGKGPLTEGKVNSAEKFICKLYGVLDAVI